MSRSFPLKSLLMALVVISLAACQSSSGDDGSAGPSSACEETPWDCACESSADCPEDWGCTYGKCYMPDCHIDCICGPLPCWEADRYGYSCDDCDTIDVVLDFVRTQGDVEDTGADMTLDVGPTEPAPCSPEAQGLSGAPVGHSSGWPLYDDCSWRFDDLGGDTFGPVVTVATSAEDFAALFDCNGDKPADALDYSTSQMVLIRGLAEISPRPPSWVLEIDGVVWVDATP